MTTVLFGLAVWAVMFGSFAVLVWFTNREYGNDAS